jgi:hypothetical protein
MWASGCLHGLPFLCVQKVTAVVFSAAAAPGTAALGCVLPLPGHAAGWRPPKVN